MTAHKVIHKVAVINTITVHKGNTIILYQGKQEPFQNNHFQRNKLIQQNP